MMECERGYAISLLKALSIARLQIVLQQPFIDRLGEIKRNFKNFIKNI